MKCQIPEISWHNRDPVLTVDIQPKAPHDRTEFHRLASGGTDSHVLIWYMKPNADCGTISLDLAADLTRHQRAVNAVRWSPSGELLASGDDESVIFIWKQKGETEAINIVDTTNDQDKEIWLTLKILRGHMEDVYDLSWSADSQFLISGSVDNSAIVWDVTRGKSISILGDHKGFVQGVAWDPKDKYLATLSTDRYFRVFDMQTKKVIARNNKGVLSVPKSSPLHGKTMRLYHDDTLQTFFRRLSFSPDGNLIVTPAGVAEMEGVSQPLNTTYVYSRASLKQPVLTLPSPDQYTIAVKFCPIYYKHRPHADSKPPIIPLPYRMIFAVATKSSVYLYDTQQKTPFALISNIHYTRLTDLSWSSDGNILIVSSTDGFCSLITFADGELGDPYAADDGNKETTPRKENQQQEAADRDAEAERKMQSRTAEEKVAQPIAFRRKPKETPDEGRPAVIDEPSPEFVIEKEKIISSQDKFDSPSKKNRPVTPIAVRRHPRTPTETTPQGSSSGKKEAMPIVIRRYTSRPTDGGGTVANKCEPTPDEEDAVDTWPIDEPKPTSVTTAPTAVPFSADCERTEDIKLVISDDEEDPPPVLIVQRTTNVSPPRTTPKTPRRVEFRTISTPKSKKKLL